MKRTQMLVLFMLLYLMLNPLFIIKRKKEISSCERFSSLLGASEGIEQMEEEFEHPN